jgi:CubicO group peptidase (beta-lactamase class C family)
MCVRIRFIVVISLLVRLALPAADALENLPGPKNPSPLDEFILEGMKEAKVPGLAALTLKAGKIFWSGYYGWANIETKTLVTQNTLFQLASISKTVTACMIMQQVEQGKLKLDADINTLLPFKVRNPKYSEKLITLRQLLTHTSGIRDNWSVLEEHWVKNGDFKTPLAESLPAYLVEGGEFFSAKKSFYGWAPGTKNQYCNVAVALAAYVAEVELKTPFEALCQQGLFKPLGMEGAGFLLASVDPKKVAMPYAYRKKTGSFKALGHHGYLDFPAGTLRATAPHMARFLLMFMGEGKLGEVRVLKAATVEAIKKIQFPKIDKKQGIGWYYTRMSGRQMIGHDGGDPGVVTQMFCEPKDGTGIIVLMNGEPKKGSFEKSLTQLLMEQIK